jgi:PiT family inorganic phosphate transporter
VLFIFLAPIIGGFIAYLIAVVTISRSFWKKMLVILLLSGVTIAVMEYMIEFIDMKPIMMYIVIGMIAVFILVYIWFEIAYGSKRPSAVKEANMHKKLQLLSSAAFSLGHGGAWKAFALRLNECAILSCCKLFTRYIILNIAQTAIAS